MKKYLKTLSVVLSLTLVMSAFAGCTAKTPTPAPAPTESKSTEAITPTPAPEKSKDMRKVTVSEVTHSVFYAPQYVAINNGFFAEEGIEIELLNGGGADKVMAAVLSNGVDIGFSGPEASIYVYNEGKENHSQIFAQMTQRDGSFLMSRTKTDKFDFAEMKGKTILPGRKGGVPYMTLEYVLKSKGLKPGVDITLDDSIQYNLMAGAFSSGTGDYVTLFEPTASMFEAEGRGYIVASLGEESGEIPYTAYFASKEYIEKNPELIQSFVNALYKAQVWVANNTPAEIAKVIAPSFPDTDLKLLETVVQRYKDIDVWGTDTILKETSFDRLQTVMTEAGELATKAPYDKIVNNTFSEKAKEIVK